MKFCRDMDARASPKSPRNFGIKRCCARAFQSKVKSSDHTSLCASNRFFFFVYFTFLKERKAGEAKDKNDDQERFIGIQNHLAIKPNDDHGSMLKSFAAEQEDAGVLFTFIYNEDVYACIMCSALDYNYIILLYLYYIYRDSVEHSDNIINTVRAMSTCDVTCRFVGCTSKVSKRVQLDAARISIHSSPKPTLAS